MHVTGPDFLDSATFPLGQNRVGFEGTATLQRSDWGLDWNTPLATGGALISGKGKLILDISAVQLIQAETAWTGRRL
ncbi:MULTISPECIES: YceI family protein [Streptomyces]|uniref:YceI family protein n=1 Tax=Streptomyces TaxID=1883 RepID=UPI000C3E72BB|nr:MULTISPECIES: YceI family protein [Streptomyces]PIB02741.1 hypothetical protein B1C81_37620 [Streptomyces sp. HG99]